MYGVLIALALVFAYVEVLIPLPVTVPGVKLGLGNIVVLFALYTFGAIPALLLMLVKVTASSILFGNPSIFIYSLAGGILSYAVMLLAVKSKRMSVVGASLLGGVFHNLGQLIVVFVIFNYLVVLANLPVLLLSGVATGIMTGVICNLALKSVPQLTSGKATKEENMAKRQERQNAQDSQNAQNAQNAQDSQNDQGAQEPQETPGNGKTEPPVEHTKEQEQDDK